MSHYGNGKVPAAIYVFFKVFSIAIDLVMFSFLPRPNRETPFEHVSTGIE